MPGGQIVLYLLAIGLAEIRLKLGDLVRNVPMLMHLGIPVRWTPVFQILLVMCAAPRRVDV
ncbi:MAG: hypothetical protein AAGF11_43710 [Myxococcota bacterium]